VIDSLNIFEIGSNCPVEFINPKKAVRRSEDFYDGILKRQYELIQKKHEELTEKARMIQGYVFGKNYLIHNQFIPKPKEVFPATPSISFPLNGYNPNINLLEAFMYFFS